MSVGGENPLTSSILSMMRHDIEQRIVLLETFISSETFYGGGPEILPRLLFFVEH